MKGCRLSSGSIRWWLQEDARIDNILYLWPWVSDRNLTTKVSGKLYSGDRAGKYSYQNHPNSTTYRRSHVPTIEWEWPRFHIKYIEWQITEFGYLPFIYYPYYLHLRFWGSLLNERNMKGPSFGFSGGVYHVFQAGSSVITKVARKKFIKEN